MHSADSGDKHEWVEAVSSTVYLEQHCRGCDLVRWRAPSDEAPEWYYEAVAGYWNRLATPPPCDKREENRNHGTYRDEVQAPGARERGTGFSGAARPATLRGKARSKGIR